MSETNEDGFVAGWTKAIAEMPMRRTAMGADTTSDTAPEQLLGPDLVAYMDRDDEPSEADAMTPGVEGAVSVGERVRAGLAYPFDPGLHAAESDIGDRDIKPSNIPLSIGSTWTGPDGTVYDVVAPGDVGERPRWWIWFDLVAAYNERRSWAGPDSRRYLHCDRAIPEGRAAFALVLRGDPESRAPASEIDTLRGHVGELQAEVGRLRSDLDAATMERIAHEALATRWEKRFDAEETAHLATLATLGETRSQLESAQRACEASRKARDERPCLSTALEGTIAGALTRKRMRDVLDEWARTVGAPTDEAARDKVAAEVSRIVQDHIVITSEAEPALEGLGRIELALVEGGKAKEEVDRLKSKAKREAKDRNAAWKKRTGVKTSAKPARKAKAGKRKAGR